LLQTQECFEGFFGQVMAREADRPFPEPGSDSTRHLSRWPTWLLDIRNCSQRPLACPRIAGNTRAESTSESQYDAACRRDSQSGGDKDALKSYVDVGRFRVQRRHNLI
jgi:hypothetical protein